jgi:hypothetical protein
MESQEKKPLRKTKNALEQNIKVNFKGNKCFECELIFSDLGHNSKVDFREHGHEITFSM